MLLRPSRRRLLGGFVAGAAVSVGASIVGAGKALAQENVPPLPDQYQLGPGDQLRVTVFGEPDLTGLYIVGSQGTIAYPLVGEVTASGLTLLEFSSVLQEALQEFLRSPNVSVEVANYRPFFILGEVSNPGTYPYSANLTVLNAVATAGGFTYRANRRRIFIRHAGETDERGYRLTISTPVLPGDTVRVGERFF
jgi:polysaccharide export outer membrane protein